MKEYTTVIGMDLGDRSTAWALMTQGSEDIQEEGSVATTQKALRCKFSDMAPARIAIEAGTHSPWVSRLLEELGHEVTVANPRKLRLIYKTERKSDKLDARTLARLLRADRNLLYPIRHRGELAQCDAEVLYARDALIKARTALINHVRGAVKSYGHRLLSCSTRCFHRKATDEIPEALRAALEPVLEAIGTLTERIDAYDKRLDAVSEEYPETELFRGVPGVGPVTALAFALTLDDPRRFGRSREVGPFLGLTPGRDQSGEQDPQLRITRCGNKMLRRLLVSSAQYTLGPLNRQDSELRRWGLKLAGPEDKNGKRNKRLKKRAVVAVARKLAVLLHTLWITGQVYDPFNHRNQCQAKAA